MTKISNATAATIHHSYRADIDGLRAIAVLSVIGFHFFPQWLSGGFIGVDIFFVISGFLISSLILAAIETNRFSLVNFYVRRINRIFPALILILLFSLAAGWYLLIQDQYRLLNEHVMWGAGFLYNILLLGDGGYFQPTAESRPLLHLWSLGIEEQFYICWPILLMLVWRLKKWQGVIALISLTVALSFFISVTTQNKIAGFYSPIPRFWELLIGGCLAVITIKYPSANNRLTNTQSWVGAILLIVGLIFINKTRAFPGWWALLPTLGSFLIISAGPSAWLNKHILSKKLFVWVGLISYPLYLWHWPLMTFYRIYYGETLLVTHKILLIVLSFVLAQLTYAFIEKPIRANKCREIKAIVLLICMVCVGCTAFLGFYRYSQPHAQNAINAPESESHGVKTEMCTEKWLGYVRAMRSAPGRPYECYLHDIHATTRDSSCYEKTKPSIAVWGDSHAAALYPGFKKLGIDNNFGIIEVSQAGCPSLLNLTEHNTTWRHNCNEVNNVILESLSKELPDVIVLHSSWESDLYSLPKEELPSLLENTLKIIKHDIPSAKIVVIGPVPRWDNSPEQVAYLNSLKTHENPSPVIQKATLLTELDTILRNVSEAEGVDFISPNQVLCNEHGCISKVGGNNPDYISCDYGHFTESGSEFFVDRIKNDVLTIGMKLHVNDLLGK